LGFMDVTIVSTAAPTIIADLGGLNLFAWVFSAFLIVQTVTIPIFGKLSDLYGRKRFFLLGLLVFMAGSALSGASRDIYQLIAFRALQGIGFGAFVPATIAIAGDMFPPERRGQVQGLLFSINGVAFAIAPALGSFLTEAISWRWIFYINLPVVVVSLGLIYFALRESKAANASPFSDWLGASLLVGFLGLLMMGLFLGGSTFAWTSWAEIALFVGSVLLLVGFVLAEQRAREPVLPPRLFRHQRVPAAVRGEGARCEPRRPTERDLRIHASADRRTPPGRYPRFAVRIQGTGDRRCRDQFGGNFAHHLDPVFFVNSTAHDRVPPDRFRKRDDDPRDHCGVPKLRR